MGIYKPALAEARDQNGFPDESCIFCSCVVIKSIGWKQYA
jgi:hypothetical protein